MLRDFQTTERSCEWQKPDRQVSNMWRSGRYYVTAAVLPLCVICNFRRDMFVIRTLPFYFFWKISMRRPSEVLRCLNHKIPLNQSARLIVLILCLRTSLFTRCAGRVSSFRSLAYLLRLPERCLLPFLLLLRLTRWSQFVSISSACNTFQWNDKNNAFSGRDDNTEL